MKKILLFIFWILFTTHSFAQVNISFTWDTIFLKDTYCRRLSLSRENHCWSIVNKDSSAVYEIDNADQIFNRTAGVQSVTSAKYSDIVALDSNVTLIGTSTDYLIKHKAGVYSKLGIETGFKSKNINSLERIGRNVSYITSYANQNKSGVAVGTARGLHISYNNSSFNSSFSNSFGLRNDSITIVHYINYRQISTNVKYSSPICFQGIGVGDGFLDWTHANVTVAIPHSTGTPYMEEDSVNTLVNIPINLWYSSLYVGAKHIWGTKNGLRYRNLECGSPPIKYLEGTSVNKLYEMVFFPYGKYNGNPYQRGALLIASDSGLYYDPMDWHIKAYSSVPDTLYLINVTKGYKINDIEVDSCNSRVWLATDRGIIRLNIHYTGSLTNGSILQHPNNNLPVCVPVTISTIQSSLYSYQWQKDSINIYGATAAEYAATTAGNYQVVYSYSDGCRTYKDTSAAVKIALDSNFCTPAIFPDTVHLCNDGSYLINSNCSLPSNTYQWYRNNNVLPNEKQSSYTATTGGYYKIKISNCNFSKFSDSIFIDKPIIPKPIVSISPGNILCEGDSAKLSVPSGNYSISWYRNNVLLPIYSTPNEYYVKTNAVYSAVFSKNNCTATSDPAPVSFNVISKVDIVPNKNLLLCEGDEITLTAQNNSNNYQWSSGETTKIIYKTTAGKYKVASVDYNNCKSTDSVHVTLAALPVFTLGNDTTFCEGYNIPVTISMPGNLNYSVNNAPLNTTKFDIYAPGQYVITATDFNSCKNADTIMVFNACPEIFIPNLITPNSDNKNDFFCIEGLLPDCTLEIFNRWGDRVYYSTAYNNNWNGEGLSDGIYYYTFTSAYYKRTWKGWVQVTR